MVAAVAAMAAVLACAGTSLTEWGIAFAASLLVLVCFRNYKYVYAAYGCTFAMVSTLTLLLAPKPMAVGEKGPFRGTVIECRDGNLSSQATVELPDGRRMSLLITDEVLDLWPGDIVEVDTEVLPCSRYDDVPPLRHIDFNSRAKRLSGRAVLGSHDVKIVGQSERWIFGLDRFRKRLAERLYATDLDPHVTSLLAAALLGEGSADLSLKDNLRDVGLSHLLCISGFHVGVVAGAILALLWPLVLWHPGRNLRRHLMLLCVWCYAALTGFQPSAVRAAVMITAFYAAYIMQRERLSLNALCVAFTVVLMINPYSLYSAGFQLSFSAVASLLLLGRRLNPFEMSHYTAHRIAEAVVAPLSVTIGTLPVTLMWFGTVPLLTIPANFVGLTLLPVFLLAGLAAFILDASGVGQGWLNDLLARTCDGVYGLVDSAAELGRSINPVFSPGTEALIAIALAVMAFAVLVNTEGWRKKALAALTVVTGIGFAACAPMPQAHLFIDNAGSSAFACEVHDGQARFVRLEGRCNSAAAQGFLAAYGIHASQADTLSGGRTNTLLYNTLFVSGHFRGSFVDTVAEKAPRHIVLSTRLDSRKRRKCLRVADSLGIPVTDLRHSAYCAAIAP